MINLIKVLEDRSLLISSKMAGVTGENNAEILRFAFPEKISGKNTSGLTKTLKIYNSTMTEPRSITLTNDEVNITDSMSNDTSSTIWLELSTDNFLWMSESYTLVFVPYPTFVVNPGGGGGGTGPTGDIPTRLSQLYNDVGFITAALLPTRTSQLQNDSGFITSSDIPSPPSVPTKVSDLENDSGYITSDYHDSTKQDKLDLTILTDPVIDLETLDAGFYFCTQAVEYVYRDQELLDVSGASFFIKNNQGDYVNAFTENGVYWLPLDNETDWSKQYAPSVTEISTMISDAMPSIPEIPTKISELENDSGYITEDDIPEIPIVPTDVSAFNNDAGYITLNDLPVYNGGYE